MLSWLEQKPGQKNDGQKNGICHYAREVDSYGKEQTTKIFLPFIFLSFDPMRGYSHRILQKSSTLYLTGRMLLWHRRGALAST